MELILMSLIIFVSALLQGMTSFGANMIALPLLSFFLPMKTVVLMLVTFNLFINTMILKKVKTKIDLKPWFPLYLGGIIFTIVGILFLDKEFERLIEIFVGITLILFASLKLFDVRIELKNYNNYLFPIGFLSGVLNGIASLSGPPVLVFLSNIKMDKNQFRMILTTYFLSLNVVSVSMNLVRGNYNYHNLMNIVVLLPILLIGTKVGIMISEHLHEDVFKKIVTITIGIMGILMILV